MNTTIKNSAGFSLIEILVALLIVALLVSISVPRFRSAGPSPIKKFTGELNKFMQDATQQAVSIGQIIKINLSGVGTSSQKFTIIDQAGKPNKAISFPEFFQVRDFFFDKKRGQGTEEMWFYINPDGIAQEVIFNIIDTKEIERDPRAGNYALVLNPFTSQFKLYEGFQSP